MRRIRPRCRPLLHLRVVGQNSIIVNLPTPVFRDNEFTLNVLYSGRLEPSELDREAIDLQATPQQEREPVTIPLEPRHIYSNNSYWYPQSQVTDYALATLHITVPSGLDVVASGTQMGPPIATPPAAGTQRPQAYVFQNDRPVRTVVVISAPRRWRRPGSTSVRLPGPSATPR